MSDTLIPTRALLDADQLGAALHLAGCSPTSRSSLPAGPESPAPASCLQGTELLGRTGALTDEARALLAVAADPLLVVSVIANRAGRREWQEATLWRGADVDGPFVMRAAAPEGRLDLALIPTVTQAALLVDDLMGLSGLVAEAGSSVALTLEEYAAILATSDVLQQARLGARLSRRPAKLPVLEARQLEEALAAGLGHDDTRWAVTSGQRLSPVDLSRTGGRLDDALSGLTQKELFTRAEGGHALTPAGYDLAAALGELITCSGLLAGVSTAEEELAAARLSFFRCTTSIWCGSWRADPADGLELAQIGKEAALGLLLSVLSASSPVSPQAARRAPVTQAAATAGSCGQCGKALRVGSAFCTHCGAKAVATRAAACPACGAATNPGKRFCTSCGRELRGAAGAPQQQENRS